MSRRLRLRHSVIAAHAGKSKRVRNSKRGGDPRVDASSKGLR